MLRLPHDGIALNEAFSGEGAIIHKHACALGCEGIVNKASDHLPCQPISALGEDQESGGAGRKARGRGGVAMDDSKIYVDAGQPRRSTMSRQTDRLRHLARGRLGLACAALSTEDTGDREGDWRAGLYGTPD